MDCVGRQGEYKLVYLKPILRLNTIDSHNLDWEEASVLLSEAKDDQDAIEIARKFAGREQIKTPWGELIQYRFVAIVKTIRKY